MAESTIDLEEDRRSCSREQYLYRKGELADHDQVRLEATQVELDPVLDLLRQRDARREFGQDPNEAKVRPLRRRPVQAVIGESQLHSQRCGEQS